MRMTMNAGAVRIREQALPGVGRRFDLDIKDGLSLVVVAERDGSRNVAVFEDGGDEPLYSVRLGREHAVAVGSLLLGARFTDGDEEVDASALGSGAVRAPESPAGDPRTDSDDLPQRLHCRDGR